MGEEDIRERQNDIYKYILRLDEKMDTLRTEIHDSIAKQQSDSKESHARIHQRIDEVQAALKELEHRVMQMEPTVEAARSHIQTDISFDDSRDKLLAKNARWIGMTAVGALIAWLFTHFGGGK